jgi:2-hydroxycyclohexanecarboxyl-CoA dehydrogenase
VTALRICNTIDRHCPTGEILFGQENEVQEMMTIPAKPIVVTGAASGIGRAIAVSLAQCGAIVGLLDMDAAALQQTCDSIRQSGNACQGYVVDITDYQSVAEALQAFSETTQMNVYGLVNNAGWDRARPFLQTDPAFWDKVIDINLKGPLNVTHCCLKQMVAANEGRVVSIASDAGRVGSSGEAVYSAAKGGIISLMKTLAREHARQGITFNSVCPGPTDTPLLHALDEGGSDKLAQALERAIPMKRLARPADFTTIVGYFLSDGAVFTTGQTISVSGGLTMHG